MSIDEKRAVGRSTGAEHEASLWYAAFVHEDIRHRNARRAGILPIGDSDVSRQPPRNRLAAGCMKIAHAFRGRGGTRRACAAELNEEYQKSLSSSPPIQFTMKIDESLCRRIERADANGVRRAIEHAKSTNPDRGLDVAEVAGAALCFAGPDSPFNEAKGLGIDAPVNDADVGRIIEFYHSRGARASIVLAPIVANNIASTLIRHGFIVEEHENVLAADLTQMESARDSRVSQCSDAHVWAAHSATAFKDGSEPDDALLFVSITIASHPDVIALVLRDGEDIASSGCLAVEDDGIAALFGTATSPWARGLGYQRALIADRIARAKESDASIARATAKIGTPSERNFRRFGFNVLYTRTTFALDV